MEDDRVKCNECGHLCMVDETLRFSAMEWEKFRFVNHPALRWMFEGDAVVTKKTAIVKYKTRACDVEGMYPMPDDLPHRCGLFVKIDEYVKGDDWWQQGESGSSTTSKQSWWDA